MDTKEKLLDPKSSPSTAPNTSGKRPSVRRLNKIPIYIVGGILVGFALIIALVSASKGQKQIAAEETKKGSDATSLAQSILGDAPKDGVIGAASPPALPDVSSLGTEASATELTSLSDVPPLELDPNAPMTLPPAQDMVDMNQQQYEQQKSQMFAEALRAKSQVDSSGGGMGLMGSGQPYATGGSSREGVLSQIQQAQESARSATAENTQAQATDIFNQLRQQVQQAGGQADLSTPPQPTTIPGSNNVASANTWLLNSKMEKTRHNALMTGSVIPAVATTGINSDLPGQVMAQVSQNVYDSLTGQRILIPQGSKLIGSYDSGLAYGQNRLFVAWKRIIFPDGRSLDIGSMPGSSGAGYSGFKDKVNNHYMKIWGSAVMMSLVGASMSFGTDRDKNTDGNGTTFSSELSSNLASTFGQAVAQSIQKNMNIAPTLEIRPGYRFNVVITKDILF